MYTWKPLSEFVYVRKNEKKHDEGLILGALLHAIDLVSYVCILDLM